LGTICSDVAGADSGVGAYPLIRGFSDFSQIVVGHPAFWNMDAERTDYYGHAVLLTKKLWSRAIPRDMDLTNIVQMSVIS
jgi:hypothetical protein